MIENFNNHQLYQKEEEDEKSINIEKLNHSKKSDLNAIIESDENIKIKEEEHLSEEESLGYNSNYKLFQNNVMNKDNQNIIKSNSKRKASTLSTAISQTDTFSDSNSFLPIPNIKSQNSQNSDRKTSYTQPGHVFFGRDRLNSTPITTYFEGMDFYLRGLQPEKNDYQKSNNYIEKEIFFNKDFKYKSFDLSENKKLHSNQILKNVNLEENCKNLSNSNSTSLPLENNSQNQTKINNYQNAFIPIMPKYNNCMYGKFDMPMYYFGYYNVDCKYIHNLIFYI